MNLITLFIVLFSGIGFIVSNNVSTKEINKSDELSFYSFDKSYDSKCGSDNGKSKEVKTQKNADKSAVKKAKCGDGKCGNDKTTNEKKDVKCSTSKDGKSKCDSSECADGKNADKTKKAKKEKCGSGKCGDGK